VHVPTYVVQVLFVVQLPVCLYGGYRTARRTSRSVLIWLVYGFLAAIAYPPLGAVIIFVLFLVVPQAREAAPPAQPAAVHELGETEATPNGAAGGPQTGEAAR
jgi:hypothetical protein